MTSKELSKLIIDSKINVSVIARETGLGYHTIRSIKEGTGNPKSSTSEKIIKFLTR